MISERTHFNPLSGPYRSVPRSDARRRNTSKVPLTEWTLTETIWLINGTLYSSNNRKLLVQYSETDYHNYQTNIEKAKNKWNCQCAHVYLPMFARYYHVNISTYWDDNKCYLYRALHMCQVHYVYHFIRGNYTTAEYILNAIITVRTYASNSTYVRSSAERYNSHMHFLRTLKNERAFLRAIITGGINNFKANISLYAEYIVLKIGAQD